SQYRFTVTRAVNGFFASTSQLAKDNRLGSTPSGSEGKMAGTPEVTSLSGVKKLPRTRMCVLRRLSLGNSFIMGAVTMGSAASCFFAEAIFSFSDFNSAATERKYF